MEPNESYEADTRVEIEHRKDGTYAVNSRDFPTIEADILNIGGRASAFPAGATLEFGGGETEIAVETYDDSRAGDGGVLVAVGFKSTAIL